MQMISVLLPVYNYDIVALVKTIKDQLDRCACAYEILVLDDASSDSSFVSKNQRIAQLSNCRFLQQAQNSGSIATRLALAKAAKYEWLLFLDADVMPQKKEFIQHILSNLSNKIDLLFGGVAYTKACPKVGLLRWRYGTKREAKNLSKRNKNPYASVISQHFVIQRHLALKLLQQSPLDGYGMDIWLTYMLQKMQLRVLHIDNPTIHLGLESYASFLSKSIKGLDTTYRLQQLGEIPKNYRPIQKAYRILEKTRTIGLYYFLLHHLKNLLARNLKSANPSIFLFDLYRLYCFVKIQQEL